MSRSGNFDDFKSFYPHYLAEHADPRCRRMHFVGTSGVIALLIAAVLTRNGWLLLLLPVVGYGFAWAGHYFFEHNRPATFSHPVYSLIGDFAMYRDMLTGRIRF